MKLISLACRTLALVLLAVAGCAKAQTDTATTQQTADAMQLLSGHMANDRQTHERIVGSYVLTMMGCQAKHHLIVEPKEFAPGDAAVLTDCVNWQTAVVAEKRRVQSTDGLVHTNEGADFALSEAVSFVQLYSDEAANWEPRALIQIAIETGRSEYPFESK